MHCRDFFGEILQVGDKVTGKLSESCLLDGIISEIKVVNDVSYITLTDEIGEILASNVESRFYTKPERLEKHGTLNCCYFIGCLNESFNPMFEIPLTSQTEFDFVFDDVCLAYIDFCENVGNSLIKRHLVSLRSEEDTEIIDKSIRNKKTRELCWPGDEIDIAFESKDELYEVIEQIRTCFHSADKDDSLVMEEVKTKILKKSSK